MTSRLDTATLVGNGRDQVEPMSRVQGHRRMTGRRGQGSRSQKSFEVTYEAVESLEGSWGMT